MIRIGIVGAGATVSIAHYHALGYLNDNRCKIVSVFDIDKNNAQKFVEAHNLDATIADSYDELLSCVDAVSICTPNAFHFEYASVALEKGKHILLEKPMGITKKECEILAEEAKKTSTVNAVGLVYRFSNPIIEARKIIKEKFTSVYTISGWFGGKRIADPALPFEWRMDKSKSGTGALGDFVSHLADISYFITGKKIDSVSAFSSIFIKERPFLDGMRKVENDDATVLIAKAGDTLLEFTVSRVGMDDVMLVITGDGGMINLSLRNGGALLYWPKEKEGAYNGNCIQCGVELQPAMEDWFYKEISAFLDSIEHKESDIASFDDGCYVEAVIDASYKSSLSKKEEFV